MSFGQSIFGGSGGPSKPNPFLAAKPATSDSIFGKKPEVSENENFKKSDLNPNAAEFKPAGTRELTPRGVIHIE